MDASLKSEDETRRALEIRSSRKGTVGAVKCRKPSNRVDGEVFESVVGADLVDLVGQAGERDWYL